MIFAAPLPLDLVRRRWPRSFEKVLRLPLVDAAPDLDADLHLFTSSAGFPAMDRRISVHPQKGRCFSRCLQNALEDLAALDYDEIVIVGRDCPDLQHSDIELAYERLQDSTLVIGPDHKGGVYLIGLHTRDRDLLRRVEWQKNTDCRQLLEYFGPENTYLLAVKQDLDSLEDLVLLSRSRSDHRSLAQSLLASLQTIGSVSLKGLYPCRRDRERVRWQLPPPVSA